MSKPVLERRLQRAGAGDLAATIDWTGTPRRSLLAFPAIGVVMLAAIVIPIGIAAGVTFVLASGYSGVARILGQVVFIPIALIFVAAFLAGLIRIWNRERAKYPELALFGAKRPTLYLRRFRNENPNLIDDAQVRTGPFGLIRLSSEPGLEEIIDRAMHRIGPLVCLGDPAMQRGTGAAGRFIAQDSLWQDAVKALEARANVVIIHYEPGGSVEWEVNRFLTQNDKPCIIWMESVPLIATQDSPDRLGRFPAALANVLRGAGVTADRLGGDDFSRGYLFGFNRGSIAWKRALPAARELERALKALIKTLDIGSARAAPETVHSFPLTNLFVNHAPFGVSIFAPLIAFALVLMGLAGNAIVTQQRATTERARVDALLAESHRLLAQADAMRPGEAGDTYRAAYAALPEGETHERFYDAQIGITEGLCLAAAYGPDLEAAEAACALASQTRAIHGRGFLALRQGRWIQARSAFEMAASDLRCETWIIPFDAAAMRANVGSEVMIRDMEAESARAMKPCAAIYAGLSLYHERFDEIEQAQLRSRAAERADPGIMAYSRAIYETSSIGPSAAPNTTSPESP